MIRRIPLLIVLLCVAAAEPPAPPRLLSPAEGKALAEELVGEMRSQSPSANSTNTGTLVLRRPKTPLTEIPIRIEIVVSSEGWKTIYTAFSKPKDPAEVMIITKRADGETIYEHGVAAAPGQDIRFGILRRTAGAKLASFAGSDFSVADLGLEFLSWPEQRVTRNEIRRSRACRVLESVNPNPVKGSYSRVVSWVDTESNGILLAEAYDAGGKLLKRFDANKIKKVRGEWQLQEMEISNVQANTRSIIRFDLSE